MLSAFVRTFFETSLLDGFESSTKEIIVYFEWIRKQTNKQTNKP